MYTHESRRAKKLIPVAMLMEQYIREGWMDLDTGLGNATNAGNLRLRIGDFIDEMEASHQNEKCSNRPRLVLLCVG